MTARRESLPPFSVRCRASEPAPDIGDRVRDAVRRRLAVRLAGDRTIRGAAEDATVDAIVAAVTRRLNGRS